MTLHRAYISETYLVSAVVGSAIVLPKDVSHRLLNILRIPLGVQVELFDGRGTLVRGCLNSKESSLFLVSEIEIKKNTSVTLTLIQAMTKQDKLEAIVQPLTELGIDRFIFFNAKRSITKTTDRTAKQMERLERIAIDAARQSERSEVPLLTGPINFEELVPLLQNAKSLILVGEPRVSSSLSGVMSNMDVSQFDEVVLIIGPEGGLHETEMSVLKSVGAIPVAYAPHVLRTQTAGLVGMSIIQSFVR